MQTNVVVNEQTGTVWRPADERSLAMFQTLRFLQSTDFPLVPRPISINEQGTTVTFLPGRTVSCEKLSQHQLRQAGQLLFRLHQCLSISDLTEGQITVLHGDFGPHNLVFDNEHISGVFDFEFTEPGDPLDEQANFVWCLLEDVFDREDPQTVGRRVGAFLVGYGQTNVQAVADRLVANMESQRGQYQEDYYESVVHEMQVTLPKIVATAQKIVDSSSTTDNTVSFTVS